jgi:hypothetical protein
MHLRSESNRGLAKSIQKQGEKNQTSNIGNWKIGKTLPRSQGSFEIVRRIEKHYELADGTLLKLVAEPQTATKAALKYVNPSLRSEFYWHLPNDFEQRSQEQQLEIVRWIFDNVIGATTEYGKYQASKTTSGFSIIFSSLNNIYARRRASSDHVEKSTVIGKSGSYGTIEASARLAREMNDFVQFRASPLPPAGYRRNHRWSKSTIAASIRAWGLFFGALTAAPHSNASGLGLPISRLTFGLLAFPGVFDWYLQWRERRRGFFTATESEFLSQIKLLLRGTSGWLRQHPELLKRVQPSQV